MNVSLVGISSLMDVCGAHSHNEWEIVLNLEGHGQTVIGDKKYDFSPGTIICQPPNVPHLKNSVSNFKDIFFLTGDFIPPSSEDIPVFIDDEEKTFETLMFLALRIFHKKDTNHDMIVNLLGETMLQMLSSWSVSKLKDEYVELFKNELIRNFSDPEFKISEAYEKIPYCADYLRRRFKKNIGITPGSYLNDLKINYAKKLIKQKNHSRITIAEIALLSGFYDQHYFSRVFKSVVGISPWNYAEKYRKES